MFNIFINKIGQYHIENGINCQDYGYAEGNIKCVVDGCSDGIHSEVGAKLFIHLYKQGYKIDEIFSIIISSMNFDYKNIKDYLCFTIMILEENENDFGLTYCGDGYVIKQNKNNEIEFEKLDDGEYPKYYSYNFIDKQHLTYYQEGVKIETIKYPKTEFKRVGIATDGLRYAFNENYKDDFIELLKADKINALKRLINREQKHFKDDITMAW